jgi:uncharacterized protein YjlB
MQLFSMASEQMQTVANEGSSRYDLCRGGKAEHAKALQTIPEVRLPDSDPVYGTDGPLAVLWRAATVAL